MDSIETNEDIGWSQHKIRLTLVENKQKITLCDSLSKLHNKAILPFKLIKKKNLINNSPE